MGGECPFTLLVRARSPIGKSRGERRERGREGASTYPCLKPGRGHLGLPAGGDANVLFLREGEETAGFDQGFLLGALQGGEGGLELLDALLFLGREGGGREGGREG